MTPSSPSLPRSVLVRIEVSRGSHIKRSANGGIDYLSPFPCPWNYGSAIEHPSEDGEPVDVVVLGPTLALGSEVQVELQGHVPFTDQGVPDTKWIASSAPLSVKQVSEVESFFRRYAQAKRLAQRLRRRPGPTEAGAYCPWPESTEEQG